MEFAADNERREKKKWEKARIWSMEEEKWRFLGGKKWRGEQVGEEERDGMHFVFGPSD